MNAFVGSKWEQEAWNSCLVMLLELDEAFPYLPLPNYLWVRTTGSVLRVMQREREVYMEGIKGAPSGGEDFEMREASEAEVVPRGGVRDKGLAPEVKKSSEVLIPPIVESSEPVVEGRKPPRVVRTYSKKSVGAAVAGTKELVSAPAVVSPQREVFLKVSEPTVTRSPSPPSVPASPLPSGGDHSLDEDYLEEHPLQIWVNATRSRKRLRLDHQRLDDGVLQEQPVRRYIDLQSFVVRGVPSRL